MLNNERQIQASSNHDKDISKIEFGAIIALHPNARALMTRDMDLIRKIVLEIQSWKDITPRKINIDGVDDAILTRHLELLDHAGMIDVLFYPSAKKPTPEWMYIRDLTWNGHEFAASIRDENIWSKIKSSFSPDVFVSLPLSIIKDLGIGLLSELAKKQVGL